MSYPITIDQILDATNRGLDIFMELFDIKDVRHNFKIRGEKHSSANVYQTANEWKIKDFGDTNFYFQPKSAVNAYMHEKGLGFYEALKDIAGKYGIIKSDENAFKNFEKVKYTDFKGTLNSEDYEIVTQDFTAVDLDLLGPLITPELCKRYDLYSIKSYSWLVALKKEEDPNLGKEYRSVATKFSDPFYPIFALIEKGKEYDYEVSPGKIEKRTNKDFVKIMQPKDANSRFRYFGFKPQNHIFGMDQFLKMPKPKKEIPRKDEDGKPVRDDEGNQLYDRVDALKHDRVFICCGERDSLNVASLGVPVVWFNSETAQISELQIKSLYKLAEEIIYIPDMDHTGIEAASKLALEFIDLRIAWLPKKLTEKTGWSGKALKDFTDWIKVNYNPSDSGTANIMTAFNILISNGMTSKFWSESQKYNKEGIAYGPITYQINHINAFHFLKLNGIHKVVDPYDSSNFNYVKQEGHIVTEIVPNKIKALFLNFVKEKRAKYGLRYYPDSLLNMLYSTEAISDKRIADLDEKEFNFNDYTPTSQYFFFENFVWSISKDGFDKDGKKINGIKLLQTTKDTFCKEENLISSKVKAVRLQNRELGNVKIEEDYFEIKVDKDGNKSVIIKEQNCAFFNYLVNGSRVHWKDEISGLSKEEISKYQIENKNMLNGGYKNPAKKELGFKLTADQILEQHLNLLNKLYCFGYLLHSHKNTTKAWFVLAMDNEIVDTDKSVGRSGKSLMFDQALSIMKDFVSLDARNPKLLDGDFPFSAVTSNTRCLLFDDCDKFFPIKRLFGRVTGSFSVNRKGVSEFTIPFHDSPKMVGTTNFAVTDIDESLADRLLFFSQSDWYHANSDRFLKHQPIMDFGCNFFENWDNVQWAKFINLAAQALKLFLSSEEKLEVPQSNIRKRSLIADMTKSFHEWAIDYFSDDKLNTLIDKKTAYDNLKAEKPNMKNISSTEFKSKVAKYCELNGYISCPEEMWTDKKNKRIMKNNMELLFIQTKDFVEPSSDDEDDMP